MPVGGTLGELSTAMGSAVRVAQIAGLVGDPKKHPDSRGLRLASPLSEGPR